MKKRMFIYIIAWAALLIQYISKVISADALMICVILLLMWFLRDL